MERYQLMKKLFPILFFLVIANNVFAAESEFSPTKIYTCTAYGARPFQFFKSTSGLYFVQSKAASIEVGQNGYLTTGYIRVNYSKTTATSADGKMRAYEHFSIDDHAIIRLGPALDLPFDLILDTSPDNRLDGRIQSGRMAGAMSIFCCPTSLTPIKEPGQKIYCR